MSMQAAEHTAVRSTVTVRAPVERAFEVFTQKIGSWWPENATRVELEHRHLDRHGDGWERMRDAVGSPGGWGRGLDALAAVLEA